MPSHAMQDVIDGLREQRKAAANAEPVEPAPVPVVRRHPKRTLHLAH